MTGWKQTLPLKECDLILLYFNTYTFGFVLAVQTLMTELARILSSLLEYESSA